MFYTASELKDLLIMTLQKYEESVQNQPIDNETVVIINEWVAKHGDGVLEDYDAYLTYLSNEADRYSEWEHGDNGY